MSQGGDVAIGVLTFVLISLIIAVALLYLYYRKFNRFPWQKKTKSQQQVPVVKYYEIEEIQAGKRSDYDYAEAVIEFPENRNLDNQNYDHFGGGQTQSHSSYDTAAAVAKGVNHKANVEGDQKVGYDVGHHSTNTESNVLHNKYEVVSVGASPRSQACSPSSEYNCLKNSNSQIVIQNEYDKASNQRRGDQTCNTELAKVEPVANCVKPTPKRRTRIERVNVNVDTQKDEEQELDEDKDVYQDCAATPDADDCRGSVVSRLIGLFKKGIDQGYVDRHNVADPQIPDDDDAAGGAGHVHVASENVVQRMKDVPKTDVDYSVAGPFEPVEGTRPASVVPAKPVRKVVQSMEGTVSSNIDTNELEQIRGNGQKSVYEYAKRISNVK